MDIFSISRIFSSNNHHLKPEGETGVSCHMVLPSLELEICNRETFEEAEDEKNINDNVSVGVKTLKEFSSKRQTFHHLSEQEDACKYN